MNPRPPKVLYHGRPPHRVPDGSRPIDAPRTVWFDCDTGVDDAVALLILRQLDHLHVVGVSAVAGNAPLALTAPNTLDVVQLAGADWPVFAGAAKPLLRDQITAPYVHGQNGLGDIELPPSDRPLETGAAWDALYDAARAADGLTVIAVGPLTNIALALIRHEDLPQYVDRIVIMGGAAVGGNVTPVAEFNIYADPEAAEVVFSSGIPVTMTGLDVTMQAYLTPEEHRRLGCLPSPQARFAHDCLIGAMAFSRSLGLPGICLHDPAAVLTLHHPAMFRTYPAWVHVETHAAKAYGKTVTDVFSDHKKDERIHTVVTDVDRDAFKTMIFELLERYNDDV